MGPWRPQQPRRGGAAAVHEAQGAAVESAAHGAAAHLASGTLDLALKDGLGYIYVIIYIYIKNTYIPGFVIRS